MSASVCMQRDPLTLIVRHGKKATSVFITCVNENKSGERFYAFPCWVASRTFFRRLNGSLGETERGSDLPGPAHKQAQVNIDISLEVRPRGELFFTPAPCREQIPSRQHSSFPRYHHGRSHSRPVVPAGSWRGYFSALGSHHRHRSLGALASRVRAAAIPLDPYALTGGHVRHSRHGRDLLSARSISARSWLRMAFSRAVCPGLSLISTARVAPEKQASNVRMPAVLSQIDVSTLETNMAYVSYYERLKDPRWQRRRLEIMQRADFRCEHCEAADKQLNVHHRLYRKAAMPWDYADSELQCLCEDCHEAEHGIRSGLSELMAQMDTESLMRLNGYAKGIVTSFAADANIPVVNSARATGIGDFYGIGYTGVMELMKEDGSIAIEDIITRLKI